MDENTRRPKISVEEAEAFSHARELLLSLLARYSAMIHKASDDETAQRLRAECIAYGREANTLDPRDRDNVRRINDHYPALLTRLRREFP